MKHVALAAFALAISCARTPEVVVTKVEEIGSFQSGAILGRDGGATVARHDDALIWIFGDSFLAHADADGSSLHSSSFSISPAATTPTNDNVTTPVDASGAALPFLAPTDDERAFNLVHQAKSDGTCAESPCGERFATWPGTTVVLGGADEPLITFYTLVDAAPGAYNFHGLGTSIATWSARDDTPKTSRPDLAPNPSSQHPTLLFDATEPPFGTAAFRDLATDDVVVLGCATSGLSAPCKLARVAAGHVLERNAWRFYDGSSYVADVAKAADVVDAAPIATLAQFQPRPLPAGCKNAPLWVLVYSAPLSNDVVVRTALAPEGPWSSPATLFGANHGDSTDVYDAYLHADFGTPRADGSDFADGIWTISYTRNLATPFTSETVLESVDLDVTKLCPAT